MTYRDMTFCPYYEDCKSAEPNGGHCTRPLTPEVQKNAEKWWGGPNPMITVFAQKPDCHDPLNPWEPVEEEQSEIYGE